MKNVAEASRIPSCHLSPDLNPAPPPPMALQPPPEGACDSLKDLLATVNGGSKLRVLLPIRRW